jgi:hypothetical protein
MGFLCYSTRLQSKLRHLPPTSRGRCGREGSWGGCAPPNFSHTMCIPPGGGTVGPPRECLDVTRQSLSPSGKTLEDMFRAVCWSYEAALQGVFPANDHLGQPMTKESGINGRAHTTCFYIAALQRGGGVDDARVSVGCSVLPSGPLVLVGWFVTLLTSGPLCFLHRFPTPFLTSSLFL